MKRRTIDRALIERGLIVAWLAMWAPAYAFGWGWRNFLNLCDMAVLITCVGLWGRSAEGAGSALLLSTQAVSTLLVGLLWSVDLAVRLATGRDLFGWTAYMFEAQAPPICTPTGRPQPVAGVPLTNP